MIDARRQHIKDLLLDDYWKSEADEIIDSALRVGFSLDGIAFILVRSGSDILILNIAFKTMCGEYYA